MGSPLCAISFWRIGADTLTPVCPPLLPPKKELARMVEWGEIFADASLTRSVSC